MEIMATWRWRKSLARSAVGGAAAMIDWVRRPSLATALTLLSEPRAPRHKAAMLVVVPGASRHRIELRYRIVLDTGVACRQ
jgi:hypothetical protein